MRERNQLFVAEPGTAYNLNTGLEVSPAAASWSHGEFACSSVVDDDNSGGGGGGGGVGVNYSCYAAVVVVFLTADALLVSDVMSALGVLDGSGCGDCCVWGRRRWWSSLR